MRHVPTDMLETVPPAVVTAIYAYFALVLAIGLYLHGKLWFGYRRRAKSHSN